MAFKQGVRISGSLLLVVFLIAGMTACTGSWMFRNPLPLNTNLEGIWGTSIDDVFAVGDQGVILHYDGKEWDSMNSRTTHNLFKIWGNSDSDVFAVGGSGVIMHFDGSEWYGMVSRSTDDLYGVWGRSESDVYAVGRAGTILHYDGNLDGTWDAMTNTHTDDLRNIGGNASGLFAVGANRTILRSVDNTTWSPLVADGSITGSISATADYYDIQSASASDIYIAGRDTVNSLDFILHYDGNTLHKEKSQSGSGFLSVWGNSDNNLLFGSTHQIWHYDGDNLTSNQDLAPISPGSNITGIWGTSDAVDILAVGGGGTILHSTDNGQSWSSMTVGVTYTALNGIWGYPDNNSIYAVGNGTILYSTNDGEKWTQMDNSTFLATNLMGIWGRTDSDIFAVGSAGAILHFDGSGWNAQTSNSANNLKAVWGSPSGSDIFVAGEGNTILHSTDNNTWELMTNSYPAGSADIVFNSVWGSSGADVYAVGIDSGLGTGIILHYNGLSWMTIDPFTSGLYLGLSGTELKGIWGSAGDNVFAAGMHGIILHYNGSEWNYMAGGDYYSNFNTIWGHSESDVFVAGNQMLHYNGTAWSTVPIATNSGINAIWGQMFSNVFAVGENGTILQGMISVPLLDGAGMAIPTGDDVFSVQMNPGCGGWFSAFQMTGFPNQGFYGMGPGAGKGINQILNVSTNAPNGSFTALVELGYSDAELEASGILESALRLYYCDTNANTWTLAVDGNTSGTPQWMGDSAPPDIPVAGDLGKHGIDTLNNVVWAVVDHTTDFAAGLSNEPDINLKQGSTDIANGSSFYYGAQNIGNYLDLTFTIENRGGGDLTIALPLSVSGPNAGLFSILTQPDSTIGSGDNTTFTVRFKPNTVGDKVASIIISNNDNEDANFVLNITALGFLAPSVGGEVSGIDRLKLAAPWLLLAGILGAAGVVVLGRRRKAA
jgi:photosystem II stability/assembly factor-like uncharacterized protein